MVETQLCKLRGRSYNMVFVNETYDLVINLSFTQNIVRACSMFHPHEGYRQGYRSVTRLDDARVNRTIFHNHSVCTRN